MDCLINQTKNKLSLFLSIQSTRLEDLISQIENQPIVWLDTSFTRVGLRSKWGQVCGRESVFQLLLNQNLVVQLFSAESSIVQWEDLQVGKQSFMRCRLGVDCNQFLELLQVIEFPEKDAIKDVTGLFVKEQSLHEQEGKCSFALNHDLTPKLSVPVKLRLNITLTQKEIENQARTYRPPQRRASNNKPAVEEKSRMTPSHKVYDRILHDPSVEARFFRIGYLDRFTGVIETDFHKFVTLDKELFYNSGVPFHRIQYFKYKGEEVWNRETRVNLIDGNAFTLIQ